MKRSTIRNRFIVAITLGSSALITSAATAQDWAKERLDKSPRHGEWVKVKHDDREVNCFITYPEVKDKATAVIVIHEIFGLTDWVRGVTDQLAEAGYIAIAPDLLWGKGPNGEGTDDIVKGKGDVGRAIQTLPPDQITADLNAVADYVSKVPAANGKLVVCGFCWGGRQTFRYSTNNKDLKAAFVFYGESPTDEASIARINCPVYGFYAGSDSRIGATLPKTIELMKAASKSYDPVTYEGAGHGFMRDAEDPSPPRNQAMHDANKKARDEAWARWKELLKKS
jgi:carboxymethylenebutenolidase